MSFAYMPLFTGDYLRDTRHLTPLKHGIYILALMHCWDSKGPMPLDEQECAGICNCRSADEVEALRYVLDRYFVRMEDGHYNHRITAEVAKTERLSKVFHEAGLKSAEARRGKVRGAYRTKVEGRLKVGSTKAEGRLVSPSPSPSPSLSPTPASQDLPLSGISTKGGEKDGAPSVPSDVSPKVWADFLRTRKAMRAEVTDTAIAGIRREAAKARMSLEAALAMCCERGWRGFRADWAKRDEQRSPGRGDVSEHNKAAASEWLRRHGVSNPTDAEVIDGIATER